MKAQGTPLREARVLFYGAGSSAVGVATMIAKLLVKEEGLTFEDAKKVHCMSS
jgi:malic enzyme